MARIISTEAETPQVAKRSKTLRGLDSRASDRRIPEILILAIGRAVSVPAEMRPAM
jgi:hypothetical protein